MKTRLIYTLSVLLTLTACQIHEMDRPSFINDEMREVTISADLREIPADTRTSRVEENGSYKTYWTPNDCIKVFSNGYASKFIYSGQEPVAVANFVGEISFVTGTDEESEDEKHYVWGLYPYREDATYAEPDGISRTAHITTTLPSIQTGKPGTYDDGLALTIGRSTDLSIPFKTAYSGFFVSFNRNDIYAVTLKTLDGEALAGVVTLGFDQNGDPEVKNIVSPSSSITLYAPGGTFEAGEDYYFVTLPDISIARGVSFTAKRTDGMEGTYTLYSTKKFVRKKFRNLADPVDYRISLESNIQSGVSTGWHASAVQGDNEIWYTLAPFQGTTYPVSYHTETSTGNEVIEHILPENNDGVGIIRFASSLQEIDYTAFKNAYSLCTVYLPETVTKIGESAFTNCYCLQQVNMGDNVTEIEPFAFNLNSLQSIELPEGLRSIGEYAFQHSESLKSITIPNSVTSIGNNPFTICSALESFEGKFATEDGLALVDGNKLISFAIGSDSDSYIIPDGIEEIGESAFLFSRRLTSVDLNEVTKIGDGAFLNNTNLKTVYIPSTVKEIGIEAFNACTQLNEIHISVESALPSLGDGAFTYTNNCPIYVPSAWLEVFKTVSPWSEYASRYVAEQLPTQIVYTMSEDYTGSDGCDFYLGYEIAEQFSPSYQNVAVSNVYDETTHQGVITFEQPLKYLNDWFFYFDSQKHSSSKNEEYLASVHLPDGIEVIGKGTFSLMKNLTKVRLGNSLQEIREAAFQRCEGLPVIDFPSSLQFIGQGAFNYCESLTTITLPNSMVDIGYEWVTESGETWRYENRGNPFDGCVNIENFRGKYASEDGLFLLKDWYDTKDMVVAFAYAAFPEGSSIVIPDNVTTLGWYSFAEGKFSNITLPSSLVNIYPYALYYCENLEGTLSIPESVMSLSVNSLEGCSSLDAVRFNSDNLPMINQYSFGDGDGEDFTILIPGYSTIASASRLSDDYWTSFTNRIVVYQDTDELWYHDNNSGQELAYPQNILDINGEQSIGEDHHFVLTNTYSRNSNNIPPQAVWDANEDWYMLKFKAPIKIVGEYAFYNSTSSHTLDFVSLPYTVQEIGNYAFYKCSNLTGELYLNSVFTIGISSFESCKLTSVGLPSLISLGNQAFANCTSLASVSAPLLETIGQKVFQYAKITTLELPSIKTVGEYAFLWTSDLQTIHFGASLESLGKRFLAASSQRTNSPALYFEGSTPPSVYEETFYMFGSDNTTYVDLLNIFVPNAATSASEAAFPSYYSSIIMGQ